MLAYPTLDRKQSPLKQTYCARCEHQQSESICLSTLQCTNSCGAKWAEFWPFHGCWCFWRFLVHFTDKAGQDFRDWCRMCCWNRTSFVPWAELGMLREPVNLQGLKKHSVKRQMDKIMTSSDVNSLLPPLYHRQQQPPEQQPWGPCRAGYCTWRRTGSSWAEQGRPVLSLL